MQAERDPEAVLRLYPGPPAAVPLRGLYLRDDLRPAGTRERPMVYASFLASLDGRIALTDPETRTRKVPPTIANARDWRLFQELAASADVVVTTGRYLRDLAAGGAQAGLPVLEEPPFADLIEWRRAQGKPPQPAVAIVSSSLDLAIPDALLAAGRGVFVATGAAADAGRVARLSARGVRVLRAGSGLRVDGAALVATLAAEGFGNIDMIAGAELLNTLLADGALDRLYLTQACRLLGGLAFDTLVKGRTLAPPVDFELGALAYDRFEDGRRAQLFAVYDRPAAQEPQPPATRDGSQRSRR